jgi:hypothetical protein
MEYPSNGKLTAVFIESESDIEHKYNTVTKPVNNNFIRVVLSALISSILSYRESLGEEDLSPVEGSPLAQQALPEVRRYPWT